MSSILTCVYSSPSQSRAKELVDYFLSQFTDSELTFDDLFYSGVFCSDSVYANYEDWDKLSVNLEWPEALTSVCSTESERFDYVNQVIEAVIKGEIEKPEWMIEIEGTAVCDDTDPLSPSTFLRLIPKKEEYAQLGKLLLDFLYSPNLMSTLLDD